MYLLVRHKSIANVIIFLVLKWWNSYSIFHTSISTRLQQAVEWSPFINKVVEILTSTQAWLGIQTIAVVSMLSLHTHLTPTDSGLQLVWLESLALWHRPLVIGIHDGEPEGQLVSVVVAAAPLTVAFYERSDAELFKTRAGRSQALTSTFTTRCSVL